MSKPAKVKGIFRVDGMTKLLAKKLAAKTLESFTVDKQQPTPQQYQQKLDAVTSKIFSSKKTAQLSGCFDGPEFAHDFIDLLTRTTPKGDCRDIQIMINVVAVTAKGEVKRNEKTHKVVMTWKPYSESKPQAKQAA